MRLSQIFTRVAVFALAALLCAVAARAAVSAVEEVSVSEVQGKLMDNDLAWTSVLGDGLQVILEGRAPTEAARFRAITAASTVVDASRVIDNMSVVESDAMKAPKFAIEILRNDSGISVIGLIPTSSDRDALAGRIDRIADGSEVADFLETADYPAPDNWREATDFALTALRLLPRSKISISADKVEITAIADSETQKAQWETELARTAPRGIARAITINAPRPVISPYTVRFTKNTDGTARFLACAADSVDSEQMIVSAASAVGFEGKSTCVQALGAPTSRWGDAVAIAIRSLDDLDGGTVTLADTGVTLQGLETTDEDTFNRVAGELQNDLPPVFELTTDLPRPAEASDAGPPTFTISRSPEGDVQLGGRVGNDLGNETAQHFASAKFGADNVRMGTRISDDLPANWPVRVLAGIEALAQLSNGAVSVTPDRVSVKGNTGNPDAPTIITTLLIDKLGASTTAELDITYVEALDPVLGLPTPQECLGRIRIVTEDRKILFDPGSSTLTSDSQAIMDDIAEILQSCPDVALQIAGYTDSQGREEMNQQLSQDRANAVLDALRLRRVPISAYTTEGFGEADPIADNDTADGREANRRIEFSLIESETTVDTPTTPEETDADLDTDAQGGDDAPAEQAAQ